MIVRTTDLTGHTKAGQYLCENEKRATVGVTHGHCSLPRAEQGKKCCADRRHARRKTGGALRSFKSRHRLLEPAGCWIRIAAINVTGGLSERYRPPGLRILKGKRHVLDKRRHDAARSGG